MAHIIIEISGGVLTSVYSDDPNVTYSLVDHDCSEDEDLEKRMNSYEPDGVFNTEEKEAFINYLSNYGRTSEDFD